MSPGTKGASVYRETQVELETGDPWRAKREKVLSLTSEGLDGGEATGGNKTREGILGGFGGLDEVTAPEQQGGEAQRGKGFLLYMPSGQGF